METEFDDVTGIGRYADARHGLVAGNDCRDEFVALAADLRGDGKRSGDNDRGGMAHRRVVRVVEFIAMRRGAIDQRRCCCRNAKTAGGNAGFAAARMGARPRVKRGHGPLARPAIAASGGIEQQARDLFMVSRGQARRRDGEDMFGERFCEIRQIPPIGMYFHFIR